MTVRITAFAAALMLLADPDSSGAAQRTFVASYAVDTNPCTVTQPCRSFAAAVAQTSAGGEVIVLDSAGYGPVTITQSVSIVAPPGVYAGISVLSGDGVNVAAGTTDKVVLRGLTINGQGGDTGIVVTSAGELHIEYCTVAGMQTGIFAKNATRTYVLNSVVRSNGGPGGGGLTTISPAEVYVTDSQFSGNAWGIRVNGGVFAGVRIVVENSQYNAMSAGGPDLIDVTLTESVLSGNGGIGVYATGYPGKALRFAFLRSTSAKNVYGGLQFLGNGGTALLVATGSMVVGNGQAGLTVDGVGATAIVAGSTVAGSAGADLMQQNGAILLTSANNTLTGRGAADISGTLTPNPMK